MTQEEIVKRKEEVTEEIADTQELLDVASAKLMALQRRCKHPNGKNTSFMGESGFSCPDCGYED